MSLKVPTEIDFVGSPSFVARRTIDGESLNKVQADLKVYVNGRFRVHKTTGVGRYANEIISRLDGKLRVVEPRLALKGAKGHLWEQSLLPFHTRKGLLWSPCNTGPAWYARQVVTVHDLFPIDHPEWFSKSFAQAFRRIVVALMQRVTQVITVSEFTKKCAMRIAGIPESKITVVHSGVGGQFAPQPAEAIRAARKVLELPDGRYFLSVSLIEPRKNLKRLLEAWKKALPTLPSDIWLVLAGSKASSDVFGANGLSSLPPRVFLPGYVPDEHLPALYSGARCVLYPSLAEGFGLPVLEAMACGVPVLTSKNSALIEVAGDAAWLVHPLDINAIAQGIQALAVDDALCGHLGQEGLGQAARFRWDRAADQTWNVLTREVRRSL